MNNSIYIALSRQTGLFRNMDVVANNLANVSTPGYKEDTLVFDDYLVDDKDKFQDKKIAFSYDASMNTDFKEGIITHTERDLDVAISGQGFFKVETPEGVRYVRGGNLVFNQNQEIVTQQGYKLLSADGSPIRLNEDDNAVHISADGTVTTDVDGEIKGQVIARGKLAVVTFDDLKQLKKDGNGLFSTTQAEVPDLDSKVIQGALEQSNVNSIVAMTQMIEINRGVSSVTGFMSDMHELTRRAISAYTRSS